MSDNLNVMVVGCGSIGKEYCRILLDLGIRPVAVGRGSGNAIQLDNETGLEVNIGGVETVLQKTSKIPTHAIVAVDGINLCEVTLCLLRAGVKNILVEKSG